MTNEIVLHPDIGALRAKVEALQQLLAERIAMRDQIRNIVLPNNRVAYQLLFGESLVKLLRLECEVAEMRRRLALVLISVNRNEPLDIMAIEDTIANEFTEYRLRIEKQRLESFCARHSAKNPSLSADETRELQSLYKKLARKLHPDVAEDLTPALVNLWHQTADAYAAGDLEELRSLSDLAEILSGSRTFERRDSLSALAETLSRLETRLREVAEETADLRLDPDFLIAEMLKNDRECRREMDRITKAVERFVAELNDLRERVNRAHGGVYPMGGDGIDWDALVFEDEDEDE